MRDKRNIIYFGEEKPNDVVIEYLTSNDKYNLTFVGSKGGLDSFLAMNNFGVRDLPDGFAGTLRDHKDFLDYELAGVVVDLEYSDEMISTEQLLKSLNTKKLIVTSNEIFEMFFSNKRYDVLAKNAKDYEVERVFEEGWFPAPVRMHSIGFSSGVSQGGYKPVKPVEEIVEDNKCFPAPPRSLYSGASAYQSSSYQTIINRFQKRNGIQ